MRYPLLASIALAALLSGPAAAQEQEQPSFAGTVCMLTGTEEVQGGKLVTVLRFQCVDYTATEEAEFTTDGILDTQALWEHLISQQQGIDQDN